MLEIWGSGQQEEGKLDMKTKVTDEAQMKYQVGSLHFSDRPYSMLFYGEGYKQSIITRSVPNIPSEERGSSN
uniref:Uncharacterized protein n=1 Tax=Arundo donax TaxID=35708 RepID=A0A0A9GM40_ARUDO